MSLQTCDEGLFWYYISERYHVYLNKMAGCPKPWTADKILQQYKFCNVFRRDDRTTRWLLENFIGPHADADPTLLAFNIAWFRAFNRWETGALLGWQEDVTKWTSGEVFKILSEAKFPVFTGAYIIHSEPGESKISSIIDVCSQLWQIIVVDDPFYKFGILTHNSMQITSKILQGAKHIGPFGAYQMVLDMMYCPSLLANAADRETWCCTGPGALRGLQRLDPAATMRDSLERMLDLTARSGEELAKIGAMHVPPMDIHDVEFCLCELDKYCRVKFGEGRPRSTYQGV